MKSVYAAVVAVVVLVGVLAYFVASAQRGDLVIVSPHSDHIQEEYGRAFSEWHAKKYGRGVKIDWEDHGGTSSIVKYINAEFENSPDGIGIDIMWGGGTEPYVKLAKEGRLQRCDVPSEIVSKLIPDVGGAPTRDAGNLWYGSALSGFGIIYNKRRLARKKLPVPETWQALASPKMVGEVGAADPRKSGSAHMCYEIMLQALGWEKGWGVLTLMAANSRRFYEGASETPAEVGLGQVSAGPVIDFYAWAQIRRDGPERIGFALPQSLTVLNPDAIAVLKGAGDPELASRFVEFVLSEDGQKLWVLKKGVAGGPVRHELDRIPVRPDVYAKYKKDSNVTFDISEFKSDLKFDPKVDSARRAALKDLYGATLIDPHPELVAAWRAILKRGAKPDEVAELCRPLVSNERLSEMSTNRWKDPTFRNRMITEWSNKARARYAGLAAGGKP